jgi:hypothetical protein
LRIKGKRTVYGSNSWEKVETDLYLLGIFDESGELSDYVRAGRPSTYRVYSSLRECKNGINSLKSSYKGELRPVRILTGEIVEEEATE